MAKHTQTICWQQHTNFLSSFDQHVRLAPKVEFKSLFWGTNTFIGNIDLLIHLWQQNVVETLIKALRREKNMPWNENIGVLNWHIECIQNQQQRHQNDFIWCSYDIFVVNTLIVSI